MPTKLKFGSYYNKNVIFKIFIWLFWHIVCSYVYVIAAWRSLRMWNHDDTYMQFWTANDIIETKMGKTIAILEHKPGDYNA